MYPQKYWFKQLEGKKRTHNTYVYRLFLYFRVIPSVDSLTVTAKLEDLLLKCSGSKKINYLEHVQVEMSVNFTRRGDLEVNLTSPLGTTSRLIQYRPRDNFTTLKNWRILTLQHWGENPYGVWKLTLKNSQAQRKNTGIFLFCLFGKHLRSSLKYFFVFSTFPD